MTGNDARIYASICDPETLAETLTSILRTIRVRGTADTDLRLCRFFGLSKGYWLRAPAAYDTEVAEERLAEALAAIRPWGEAHPHAGVR